MFSNVDKMMFIFSGGMKLLVSGQNLDVVQEPLMKSTYNESIFEFVSVN